MSQLPPEIRPLLPFLGWCFGLGMLYTWLGRELNARWMARLFESEGEPSLRLVLAGASTVFTLCMVAAGRLSGMQLEALLTFIGSLWVIGSARIAATAFAKRPTAPPAQIHAEKAKVSVEGDATFNEAPAREQP